MTSSINLILLFCKVVSCHLTKAYVTHLITTPSSYSTQQQIWCTQSSQDKCHLSVLPNLDLLPSLQQVLQQWKCSRDFVIFSNKNFIDPYFNHRLQKTDKHLVTCLVPVDVNNQTCPSLSFRASRDFLHVLVTRHKNNWQGMATALGLYAGNKVVMF